MSVIETARAWREQKGYVDRGGVVIVYGDKVQGWVNALRDPAHWVPGCIAVAEDGQSWTAFVGSDRDGSLMWLPNEQI